MHSHGHGLDTPSDGGTPFVPYPILLHPTYRDYIWGGSRIATKYGRTVPLDRCAESWEISDRAEGMGVVINGVYTGWPLASLVAAFGRELVGAEYREGGFPLLVKLIDAHDDLSVQVHPGNTSAALTGGEPKTEMWFVLDATPGARIHAGMKAGTTRESFLAALRARRLDSDVLATVPAVPGQAVFVPGGRVHAIGAGCLLLEVQQNSNTTYRVYDWDRVGADGKPRGLHLEQALAVIDWEHAGPELASPSRLAAGDGWECRSLVRCPYFSTTTWRLTAPHAFETDGESFHALFVVDGHGAIEGGGVSITVGPGTSCLLPAALDAYTIAPHGGTMNLVRIEWISRLTH